LEDLEQFILSTSETINEKLEDIQRQMGDLNGEIKANIELVKEKKKLNSSDSA
jgi:predicted metal-dependent hydrolase